MKPRRTQARLPLRRAQRRCRPAPAAPRFRCRRARFRKTRRHQALYRGLRGLSRSEPATRHASCEVGATAIRGDGDGDLPRVMRQHGISRRSFLKYCSLTATSLGLGRPSCRRSRMRWKQTAHAGGLDQRAGMHLLLGELHPQSPPAGQGRGAVHDLAGLQRGADGRRRPPAEAHRGAQEAQGNPHPWPSRATRRSTGRHVLHHRQPALPRAAEACARPTPRP